MTCKMRLKEDSVRIGVPQHIYIFGLNLRSEDGREGSIHFWKGLFTGSWGGGGGGGGGRQKYTFLERSLYWESKNFKIRAI